MIKTLVWQVFFILALIAFQFGWFMPTMISANNTLLVVLGFISMVPFFLVMIKLVTVTYQNANQLLGNKTNE